MTTRQPQQAAPGKTYQFKLVLLGKLYLKIETASKLMEQGY
jgi:hypothetical protein